VSSTTTKPKVTVLALGGTIASSRGAGTPLASPRLPAEEIVASVPGIDDVAEIEARNLSRLPSCDLTLDLAVTVAREIQAAAARGSHGVVVTQGTDTIEELSFCLDLLVQGEVAVVVTGAMRHAGKVSSDGPANLLDAVRTAASPDARGLGCLVVMNEEIHAAAWVRKLHTSSPAAFRSPSTGPVGWIAEGSPHLRERPSARLLLPPPAREVVRVPLVKVVLDDDGWWLAPVRETGAPGLVLEAMGGGHLPGWLCGAAGELARRIPVVITSRTGDGEVLTSTYGGFDGSETSLQEAGLIPAGALHSLKARILLCLLVTGRATSEQVRQAFQIVGRVRPGLPRRPVVLDGLEPPSGPGEPSPEQT
jgi:L-asparaginase